MQNIINEVKKLKLPLGKYSVVGSGALSVRGIRLHNDIDLIVTSDLYDQLISEGWQEREKSPGLRNIVKNRAEAAASFIHIKGCTLNPQDVIKNSDIFDGIPFINLDDLIELKKTMNREKDLKDIELIEKYLNNTNK